MQFYFHVYRSESGWYHWYACSQFFQLNVTKNTLLSFALTEIYLETALTVEHYSLFYFALTSLLLWFLVITFCMYCLSEVNSNQIKSFLLVYGVGIWEGSLGCEFLLGLMCAEGMGCGRRWVRWVLRGTGTASGHPGVPWKISPTMRWLSQPAVCSKMELPEWWRRIGDGEYSIAVVGTWMRLPRRPWRVG